MRKILSAQAALKQENGVQPTAEEIAGRSGIPADKVRELLQRIPEICSLDIPTGDAEESTLGALLEDVQSLQPQEELVRRELERTIESMLSVLNDRQRQILRLHYGMEDGICYSLEQIGAKLGISKERARQIEHQAMQKLQEMGNGMGLEDFLRD
jgi:DNA-directed RNA polymerase sigma subunit (sigma70/sigma32)